MAKIVIAVDNDPAGKVLESELARRIGFDKCYRVEYPEGCKDSNEVLVKYGVEKLREIIANAKMFPIIGVNIVDDFRDDLLRLYTTGFPPVYSTGWKTLDGLYKVRLGELTIITGFPGHGKSEFGDALLLNLALKHEWCFGICSLENIPYERHLVKLTEKVTGKPFFHGPTPRMTTADLSRAESILNDKFYFINPEMVDIDTILSITKSLILRKGINGLILDPYNEIEHSRPHGMTETEYISQFLSKVRRFARLNEIAIWIVAHPVKIQKEDRNKPPTVYDISGSANWANKADNAISVHRSSDTNLVKIQVQKIRFKEVGEIGEVDLIYNSVSGRYFDTSHSPKKWSDIKSVKPRKSVKK